MPSAFQILDRIMRLRTAGKIIHPTPNTPGIVEAALRAAIEPPQSNRHPADALAYRIDEWSPDGGKHADTLAFIGDFAAAQAAWEQFTKAKPNERLTWRHGTLVIQERPWSDKFAKNQRAVDGSSDGFDRHTPQGRSPDQVVPKNVKGTEQSGYDSRIRLASWLGDSVVPATAALSTAMKIKLATSISAIADPHSQQRQAGQCYRSPPHKNHRPQFENPHGVPRQSCQAP